MWEPQSAPAKFLNLSSERWTDLRICRGGQDRKRLNSAGLEIMLRRLVGMSDKRKNYSVTFKLAALDFLETNQ